MPPVQRVPRPSNSSLPPSLYTNEISIIENKITRPADCLAKEARKVFFDRIGLAFNVRIVISGYLFPCFELTIFCFLITTWIYKRKEIFISNLRKYKLHEIKVEKKLSCHLWKDGAQRGSHLHHHNESSAHSFLESCNISLQNIYIDSFTFLLLLSLLFFFFLFFSFGVQEWDYRCSSSNWNGNGGSPQILDCTC